MLSSVRTDLILLIKCWTSSLIKVNIWPYLVKFKQHELIWFSVSKQQNSQKSELRRLDHGPSSVCWKSAFHINYVPGDLHYKSFFSSVSTDRENASFKRTSPETNILCLVAFKNSGILRRKLNDDVFYFRNRSYLVNLNTVGIWFSLLEQNGQKK